MGTVLPPAINPPEPPQPADDRAHKVKCEFCECILTPHGDVLRMSDKARELNRQGETIRELKEDIGSAEAAGETYKREAETLRGEVATLRGPKAASSFFA